MRAVHRVQSLGLSNCRFYQGNMDYFKGRFDIGVSLHACGVATDLVIQACIRNGASFVSCPCCYGSLQKCHMLSYPRSNHFAPIDFKVSQENLCIPCTINKGSIPTCCGLPQANPPPRSIFWKIGKTEVLLVILLVVSLSSRVCVRVEHEKTFFGNHSFFNILCQCSKSSEFFWILIF